MKGHRDVLNNDYIIRSIVSDDLHHAFSLRSPEHIKQLRCLPLWNPVWRKAKNLLIHVVQVLYPCPTHICWQPGLGVACLNRCQSQHDGSWGLRSCMMVPMGYECWLSIWLANPQVDRCARVEESSLRDLRKSSWSVYTFYQPNLIYIWASPSVLWLSIFLSPQLSLQLLSPL